MPNLYLMHHGVKGMHWGVRRYQNLDGSYTSAGRKRYGINDSRPHYSVRKKIGLSKRTKKALKIGLAVAGTAAVAYGGYKLATSERGKEILSNILSKKNPPVTDIPKPSPNIKEMIDKARSMGTLDSNPKSPSNLKVLDGGKSISKTNSGGLKVLDGGNSASTKSKVNSVLKEFRPQDFKHVQLMQMDAKGNVVPGPKMPADGKAYAEAYAKFHSDGSKEAYKEQYAYIVKQLKRFGGTLYDDVKF